MPFNEQINEQIHQQNHAAIEQAISGLEVINYETVSKSLPRLLAKGLLPLEHSIYTPTKEGVGRFLIYDHVDQENPFSIWVFAFAPRQKTSIHDHKYKGTVTVLEGPVSEKFYLPTGNNAARRVARVNRHRFHTNSDDLNDPFVHQLKRCKSLGEGISVTMHIYNMEAHCVNQEGDKVDRRNLNQIYSKDKSPDGIPPYKGEYEELYSSFSPR